MNSNYRYTITLYHCSRNENNKDVWTRSVLHNCFWKSVINTGFSGTQASVMNTYVVRIPFAGTEIAISQGDVVVLGECAEEITGASGHTVAQLLLRQKPNAFKVTALSDNTSFPVAKHYRLGG